MRIPYVAAALLPILVLACSKKKGDDGGGGSGEELGSTPKVETLQQPDSKTMQDDGEVVDVDNDEVDVDPVLNAPGTLDLRPDAPTSATFPSLQSVDPRTFVPSGSYAPGGGKVTRSIFSGQLAIPDDGRSHVLPACAHPFAAPGHFVATGLTVDGNLGEWPVSSVIAVDRGGDGGNSPSDLREVYFAKNGSSMYLGIKVNGAVAMAGTLTQRVALIFSSLAIPTDTSTTPGATQQIVFELWGPNLKDGSLNPYPGSGTVYDVAASGSSLELRLDLGIVEDLMGGGPYTVEVAGIGRTPSNVWVRDNSGVHVVGLTDDYACMVEMPNADRSQTTSKMFVMRRADSTIAAGVAEQIYRAMIQGSRAAEYVAKDHLRHWDTLNFTVVKAMAPAGVNVSNAGIFLEDDVTNIYGETGDPTYLTFVAAHEYLHSFNASDYQLAENWMTEGHSNWLATRAIGSYFGQPVATHWFDVDLREFRQAEADNGVQTITNAAWGAGPNSGLFYYHKAATLYELMQTKTTYDAFLDGVLQVGVDSTPFAGRDDFLTAYKALPNYSGSAGDNLTGGWWGGDYAASIFPLSLLEDTDHDGLLNFQEKSSGSTLVDTDGDHASDLFETVYGMNPNGNQDVTYIAQDNSLTDWTALAPSWLHTELQSTNTSAPCGDFARLKHYGAVVKEGWVYVSAEVQRTPAAGEDLLLVVFVDGGPEQFIMQHGESTIWHGNPTTRPAYTMQPWTGPAVEIAYNTALLGWAGGVPPSGTTFNVATFSGSTQCDLGATVTP